MIGAQLLTQPATEYKRASSRSMLRSVQREIVFVVASVPTRLICHCGPLLEIAHCMLCIRGCAASKSFCVDRESIFETDFARIINEQPRLLQRVLGQLVQILSADPDVGQ